MNADELNKKLLENPEVKKADEDIRLAYEIAEMIIEARAMKNLTQKELADLTHTHQPSIARIERGNLLPSLSFLDKIAKGLGTRLLAPRFEMLIKNIEYYSESTHRQAEFTPFIQNSSQYFLGSFTYDGQLTNNLNLQKA